MLLVILGDGSDILWHRRFGLGLSALAEDIELVVCELVTNAVKATAGQ